MTDRFWPTTVRHRLRRAPPFQTATRRTSKISGWAAVEYGSSESNMNTYIDPGAQQRRIQGPAAVRFALYVFLPVALLGLVDPYPYAIVISILIAFPWICVVLALQSGAVCSLKELRNPTRSNIAPMILGSTLVLGVRMSDQAIAHWQRAAIIGCTIAALMLLAIMRIREDLRDTFPMLGLMALLMIPYGYSSAVLADSQLDRSTPTVFKVLVERKWTFNGRSALYHVVVSPWGQHHEPVQLSVGDSFYSAVNVGGYVCIYEGKGALGIGWWQARFCNSK